MDPRTCVPATGDKLNINPIDMLAQDGMATHFSPFWNDNDQELDRLINQVQFCVNKENSSLMFYPIALENVFVTGWRDPDNRRVVKRPNDPDEGDIKLELHVVGSIPTLWARFFNRKFIFNGTEVPLPMYQPEVVDRSR